jgi:hypothetical protein
MAPKEANDAVEVVDIFDGLEVADDMADDCDNDDIVVVLVTGLGKTFRLLVGDPGTLFHVTSCFSRAVGRDEGGGSGMGCFGRFPILPHRMDIMSRTDALRSLAVKRYCGTCRKRITTMQPSSKFSSGVCIHQVCPQQMELEPM